MQIVHYIMFICAALGAGLPLTAEAFPPSAAPYFKGAAAVCVLLTAVCGAISPPASGGSAQAPRPPRLPTGLALLVIGALAFTNVAACSSTALHKIEAIAADAANCLIQNQDLPDDQALLKCGVDEAQKVLATEFLHNARKDGSERAAKAAALAREKALRESLHACGDGGAR